MMDAGSIISLIGGAKTSLDLLLTAKEIKDNYKYNQALLDIQAQLMALAATHLELQNRYASALTERDDAKEKYRELVQQTDRLANYRLKDFGSSTFAYVEETPKKGSDDPHYLCPNCYLEGKPSILQFQYENQVSQKVFKCHRCNSEFPLGSKQIDYEPNPPRRRGFDPFEY